MSLPPDQAAREAGARTFDRNVVVIAGAGSGKTTLLVERILNLALGRGVPLGSVLALTFTEKAAAEMRSRLAAQLSRALELIAGDRGAGKPGEPATSSLAHVLGPAARGGLGVDPAVVRSRALAALHDLDAAGIGTIHAACADLLRRHPASARLDPAFVVDDGSRSDAVVEDEWIAFQARSLRPDAPEAADWRRVLATLDAPVVLELARKLVSSATLPETVRSTGADAALRAQARALAADCERILTFTITGNVEGWTRILLARLRALEAGGAEGLARHDELNPPEWPTASQPKPPPKCADPSFVDATLKRASKLTDALLQADDALCDAALALARAVAVSARARLAAEGVVGFAELLVRARDVLRDDAEARRQAQARIDALLLDEFQDTDPLQYEIAFLLAEDPAHPVPPGGDPWSARLLPGRLFVVGDPKQSIYRFRGADMAAATRAIDMLAAQGALRLSLVANFRSRHEVLDPVNDLCESLMAEEPPYQAGYERLVAARPDAAAGERRIDLLSVLAGPVGADEWRLAEARAIARLVRGWRAGGVVRDFGSVVILLRAMTGADAYQRGLAEAGIPFVTQGGKGFFAREEVVHAITLLRCLAHPHDGPALLAVLRSPSCGADDAEIRLFSELTGRAWSLRSVARLDEAARARIPRVARAVEGLRRLAERVAALPADEAVAAALLGPAPDGDDWSPNLLAIHAACRNGAQRLANLEKLVFRAESMARADGLSLPRIVERLEEEMSEGAPHGESPLADESLDAVRIMTIHQAKGLEFDAVVLPDLAREEGGARRGGVELLHAGGVTGLRLPGGVTSASWHVLSAEDERHDRAERLRTLYVALTRAKERLVLVNGSLRPKSSCFAVQQVMAGWSYEPGHGSGGERLHVGVRHEAVELVEVEGEEGETPRAGREELAAAVLAQDEATARMAAARRPRPRSPSGIKEQREAELRAAEGVRTEAGVGQSAESPREASGLALRAAAAAPARDRSVARAVGVAVHLALETAGALDDGEALAALGRRAARLAAIESGADEETVARECEALLRGVPGSSIARALKGATVLARELPFLLPDHAGGDWQGFVDLVVERGGATWVVDWKTDAQVDPGRHREQLEVYAEAVRRWRGLSEPPRTALAYVAKGKWVETA